MELFHVCDEAEDGRGNFCIFSHYNFEKMGRKTGYPRCVRHGRMLSSTVRAMTRQEARKKVKGDDE